MAQLGRLVAARVRAITNDDGYASQLTSMISEFNLTDADAMKIYSTINLEDLEANLPHLKALAEVAKYEGFNPREMITSLIKIHNRTHEDIIMDPTMKITMNLRQKLMEE